MHRPLTLPTLAKHVAPDLWHAYEQAISVQDRESDLPPEWLPQIAADAEAYVERRLAERLHAFDTSDLYVVSRHLACLGVTSSGALDRWKAQTKDWPRKVAEYRERRDEYASETRGLLRETAVGIVSEKSARDRVRALGRRIVVLLRAHMIGPGCVVRATPKGSLAPRVVEWVELREAIPDIQANTLTIDGIVFLRVQVELPAQLNAADEAPVAETNDAPPSKRGTMVDVMAGWFRDPKGGGAHRYSSNAVVCREFKKEFPEYRPRKITKTSIGQARDKVGWSPRGRTSNPVEQGVNRSTRAGQ